MNFICSNCTKNCDAALYKIKGITYFSENCIAMKLGDDEDHV